MATRILRIAAYISVIAIAAWLGITQYQEHQRAQERAAVHECRAAVAAVEAGKPTDATQATITRCLFAGHLTQADLDAALARMQTR